MFLNCIRPHLPVDKHVADRARPVFDAAVGFSQPRATRAALSQYIAPAMGRTKRWDEDMLARFPAGTFARIAAALNADEDRTDFVRGAVERELERRAWRTSPIYGEEPPIVDTGQFAARLRKATARKLEHPPGSRG
jgi:hypothetical protein